MDYGRERSTGKIVRAAEAMRGVGYACPTCGLPLELRRGDDLEYFAHRRGLPGTQGCELFTVGDALGRAGSGEARAAEAAVEDEPSKLGLIVGEIDARWEVGLRLPEIPSPELGDASLAVLRGAYVDVFAGRERLVRLGALDLRPGVGAARVGVAPRIDGYQAQVGGSWPATIETARWQLHSSPLDASGTLFRLRGGEWTRLSAKSGVHHGETLLVVAEAHSPPPQSIVRAPHGDLRGGGSRWGVWEVRLPAADVTALTEWLARVGHSVVPRPWGIALSAPARAYTDRGAPTFWVGDAPVVALQAPRVGAEAMVRFNSGTNSLSACVRATESGEAFVQIESQEIGSANLTAVAQRSTHIDIAFVQRPDAAALLEQLKETPRVRVWVGEIAIEAWRGSKSKIPVDRALPEVRVNLGVEDARARVTVWERGKQRSRRGLDARSVARVISEALPTASRIEVDGDNLGRLEIVPTRAAAVTRETPASNRLAWYDHVVSLTPPPDGQATPTILQQSRAPTSLTVRPVGASTLLRTRQALRRRHEAGGER